MGIISMLWLLVKAEKSLTKWEMQIENVEISEVVDIIDTIEDTLIQDLDPEIKEGDKEKEDRIRKEGVIVEEEV